MEGANANTLGFAEIIASFKRKPTLLWKLFGIGLTYLYSAQDDKTFYDTKIRNDLVPTRCDVGYYNWYYTQLGDEDEKVASYEPEKGPNAIILAVKRKSKIIFKEFSGFVELIDACSDLKNAYEKLGFEKKTNGNVIVCPTHVELEDDIISMHIMCYFKEGTSRDDIYNAEKYITEKYTCSCVTYRMQNP